LPDTSQQKCEQRPTSKRRIFGAFFSLSVFGFLHTTKVPWERNDCEAAGGAWIEQVGNGVGTAPECLPHPVNSEGENQPLSVPFYDWVIPQRIADTAANATEGQLCVLRIRFNMTWADVPDEMDSFRFSFFFFFFSISFFFCRNSNCDSTIRVPQIGVTAPAQCDQTAYDHNSVPLFTRPSIMWDGSWTGIDNNGDPLPTSDASSYFLLSMATNTNQVGRVFQDRTHVFRVKNRPTDQPGLTAESTIWNLNTRGRRGNKFQAFPSMEYGFVPSVLEVSPTEWIHIQFHGSQYNAARVANRGEGWMYGDAQNLVQIASSRHNFPLPLASTTMFGDPADPAV
jgi:hypothetical protein